MARVRWGELSGAKVTRSVVLVTRRSAALARGGLEKRSSFLPGSSVVRSHQAEQIALGLIGEHFDQVGQVFAFRRQFDHRLILHALDRPRAGEWPLDASGVVRCAAKRCRFSGPVFHAPS